MFPSIDIDQLLWYSTKDKGNTTMNIRSNSTLNKVKVNMLTREITLYGDDGEELLIENNTSNEFVNMCNFINNSLPDEMIEYTY